MITKIVNFYFSDFKENVQIYLRDVKIQLFYTHRFNLILLPINFIAKKT